MCVHVIGVRVCVSAHKGLHPLLIHLISSNRPQGRGINLVFDLLLFPPYLPLLSFPLTSSSV